MSLPLGGGEQDRALAQSGLMVNASSSSLILFWISTTCACVGGLEIVCVSGNRSGMDAIENSEQPVEIDEKRPRIPFSYCEGSLLTCYFCWRSFSTARCAPLAMRSSTSSAQR